MNARRNLLIGCGYNDTENESATSPRIHPKKRPIDELVELAKIADKPPGFVTVWKICDAINKEGPIGKDLLQKLNHALSAFLKNDNTDESLKEFAKRLKLRGKQGEGRAKTFQEHSKNIAIGLEFKQVERELMNSGVNAKKAHTKAKLKVAKDNSISPRWMGNILKDNDQEINYQYINAVKIQNEYANSVKFAENLTKKLSSPSIKTLRKQKTKN